MTSNRQIAANRRNAKLSCGPRTIEGLAVSRTNARKHGLSKPVTEDGEGKSRTAAIHRVLQNGMFASEKSIDLVALAEYLADMQRIRAAKAAVSRFHRSDTAEIVSEIQAVLKLDRYAQAAISRLRSAIRQFELANDASDQKSSHKNCRTNPIQDKPNEGFLQNEPIFRAG